MVLPLLREPHDDGTDECVGLQEVMQSKVPAGAWCDPPHEIFDDNGQGVVAVVRAAKDMLVPFGDFQFDHELAVPKTPVMGADVSDVGQDMKPV